MSGEVDTLGGAKNKELIGIAAEKRGSATGRIRLQHFTARDNENIHGFIIGTVAPGSKIISDRWKSYYSIIEKGYDHEAMKKPYSWENVDGDDDRLLPRVGRATSLLKRWYYGTYQGRIDKQNLQPYLDEYVFRFNRRTSGSRGLVFHRMVESAVHSIPRPS